MVWMAFMLVETALGMVREVFVAPVVGGLRARQMAADGDPTRGGLMPLGLAFMFVTPMLVARPDPREPSR
jgi:hypothetical protein